MFSPLTESNVFMVFMVLLLGALFYKFRNKKKNVDDEYVKADQEDKGILSSLTNPFNRKKDNDKDDFDKMLWTMLLHPQMWWDLSNLVGRSLSLCQYCFIRIVYS